MLGVTATSLLDRFLVPFRSM